jgi:hypothetical protein
MAAPANISAAHSSVEKAQMDAIISQEIRNSAAGPSKQRA